MGTKSKEAIKSMIQQDMHNVHNRYCEVKKSIKDNLEETMDYLYALIAQIPQSHSGPLITKTPKVLKKRAMRIETIPEDQVVDTDQTISESNTLNLQSVIEMEDAPVGRTKREASKKAFNNIKKQQSLLISQKMRRPSDPIEDNAKDVSKAINTTTTIKKTRASRTKRKKSARSSSEEEEARGPSKHSKVEDTRSSNHLLPEKPAADNKMNDSPVQLRQSSRRKLSSRNSQEATMKAVLIDDTVIAPSPDDDEASMYEDALGKPTPIMNSTMNCTSTVILQKMMNATVVLEQIPLTILNETVTIQRKSKQGDNMGRNSKLEEVSIKREVIPEKTLQDRLQQVTNAMASKVFDDVLNDDDSSPEIKKPKRVTKKQQERKRQEQIKHSLSSGDDEVLNTPTKTILREANTGTANQDVRNIYKKNALFSPYAKESVKKRVEAFEQAGVASPKAVEIDAPTRVTRTKTRAIAAAQAEATDSNKAPEKMIAQKLARKSLAKAKRISLARHVKDVDEHKENKVHSAQKITKAIVMERINYKQQQKTTPLGKSKLQLPMTASRIPQTPSNSQIPTSYPRALSATRSNIVTTMDSFIQSKTVSKHNSTEKYEEKKKKISEEDARRKREEALRLQTEERRRKRQEKELKNKLAREAKERQDMEKRQKAEKEREEKARAAQQVQERQREEMEKKRLAQLQRAQEKEERRRQEEQARIYRLQEQEEAERVLAEQRRRELEAEKRREAELRAQQQTAAEAIKLKNQMLAAKAKQLGQNGKQGPTNYILESEPDEDESEDESRPKYDIPYWAQSHVRKSQLAMQRYIPEPIVLKFFDSRKCTPDLTKLFRGIDRSRLKRTSSAIWKSPPRYSRFQPD